MFRQLIYTSQEVDGINEDDRQDILRVSRANNARDDVTGFLISTPNGTFVQTLEGPAEGVARVLERIRQDPRHSSMTIILDHEIPARDFPDWRMGYRSVRREDLRQYPEFRDLADPDFATNFDSAAIAMSIMKALYTGNR